MPPSPVRLARIAGALYLAIFLVAPLAEFAVRESLIVAGDPATTAANIVRQEAMFRAGLLGDLVVFVIETAQAAILFVLLRPAGPTVALVMAFARLAQATILGLNLLQMSTALDLLTNQAYAALPEAHRQAQAFAHLSAQRAGYDLGLMFFALHLSALGWLVFRAGFLPRLLGVLLGVSAAGYAFNSLCVLALPSLAATSGAVVVVTALAGELPLTLWLLIKGVDERRWRNSARATQNLAAL